MNSEINSDLPIQYIGLKNYRTGSLASPKDPYVTKNQEAGDIYYINFTLLNEAIMYTQFYIEKTKCTLRSFKTKSGDTQYKLYIQITDPEDVKGCDRLDEDIQKIFIDKVNKSKVNIEMKEDKEIFVKTFIRSILTYKTNTTTNEIDHNSPPYISLSLDNKNSIFAMPHPDNVLDTIPIPYENLENYSWYGPVVFNLRDLFASNLMSTPQCFVKLCLICTPPSNSYKIDVLQSSMKRYLDKFKDKPEQLMQMQNIINNLKNNPASLLTTPSVS